MSEEKESTVSENDAATIAQYFFNPPKSFWPILAVLVAISIFSLWALRSAFELVTAVVLTVIYSIISLLTLRFNFREINTSHDVSITTFSFVRAGVSWKVLMQALLGAAIPLLLAWFVVFNTTLDSTDLADIIMLVAMILYIGIIPLTPALASASRFNILKTRLVARVNSDSQEVLEFELDINSLDGYWFEHREDQEFIDAVTDIVLSYLNEQGSI